MRRLQVWLLSSLLFAAGCAQGYEPGAVGPTLQGAFDKVTIGPGESATLTWQTTREGDSILFVGGAIFARAHAAAKTVVVASVPATALQMGVNAIVVSVFTADGRQAHLPLSLELAALGAGSSAGTSAGNGSSSGTGSSSGGGPVTIAGTMSALYGSGLSLQLTSPGVPDETVLVGANSLSFSFTTSLAVGSAYAVGVTAQPTAPAQTCQVTSGTGSGTANANVTTVAVTCSAPAVSEVPRVVFSDLTQAPAGAYVTLYGFNLDGAGARVTAGGGPTTIKVGVAAASARGSEPTPLQSIVVQLPPVIAAGTQPLVFFKGGHVPSEPLTFSVAATGTVSFYSPSGTGDGSKESTPAAYAAALTTPHPGDVRYLRAGAFSGTTGIAWSVSPSAPFALVGYPGETVTVSNTGGATSVVNITGTNLTLSHLTFGATSSAFSGDGAQDVVVTGGSARFVGNTWLNPRATNGGIVQLFIDAGAHDISVLGNDLKANDTDSSNGGSSIELGRSGNVSGLEIGYNELEGCREASGPEAGAIELNPGNGGATIGSALTPVSIHHNSIRACSGAAFSGELIGLQAGSGASLYLTIENNLFLPPSDALQHRGVFYVDFGAGAYSVVVNHNTMATSQTIINVDPGSTGSAPLVLKNNVFVSVSGTQHACAFSSAACTASALPTQTFNDWYGMNWLTTTSSETTADPSLDGNYVIRATSAALIDQITTSDTGRDYIGVPRPQGAHSDIGAFEYTP